MIILRPKNVIFERFWPFSKFHFPACTILFIINKIELLSSDEERFSNPFDTDGPAVLVGFLSGSYFVHSGITNLENRSELLGFLTLF